MLGLADDGLCLGTDIAFSLPYADDGLCELLHRRILQHVAVYPGVKHALDDRVFIMDGDGDDLHLRIGRDDLLTEINAVAYRHRDVEQQHVGAPFLKCLATGFNRVERPADADVVAAVDGVGEALAHHDVVVDDVDVYAVLLHAGSMMLISVPCPSLSMMFIVPR